jgi:hypothetical protein
MRTAGEANVRDINEGEQHPRASKTVGRLMGWAELRAVENFCDVMRFVWSPMAHGRRGAIRPIATRAQSIHHHSAQN